MEIIRPGQYAAFSKRVDTGGSCDPDGEPFTDAEQATCLIFDGLEDARAFCEGQVARAPAVRFEIFDSTGRTNAPLLVIVHPSRVSTLEGNPRGTRVRRVAAAALLATAAGLFWYDYQHDQGMLIFPSAVGVNLIVVAARLIQLNSAYATAEWDRKKRLEEHTRPRG